VNIRIQIVITKS